MQALILLAIPPMKVVYYTLLLGALALSLGRMRALPRHFRVFPVLLGAALVVQVLDDVLDYAYPYLFHVYHVIEFTCLALYLHAVLRSRRARRLLLLSVPLYVLLIAGYFTAFPAEWNSLSLPEFVLMGLVLSTATLLFFYELYTADTVVSLARHPDFWIGMGNLLFYSGAILVFGLFQYLALHDKALAGKVIQINYVLNLLLYSTYVIAFLCQKIFIKS